MAGGFPRQPLPLPGTRDECQAGAGAVDGSTRPVRFGHRFSRSPQVSLPFAVVGDRATEAPNTYADKGKANSRTTSAGAENPGFPRPDVASPRRSTRRSDGRAP